MTVESFEVIERRPYAGSRLFGDFGPFEISHGRIHYAVDPESPRNAAVVDLALAPRDDDGMVRFHGDFTFIHTVAGGAGKPAHTLLIDVPNRGRRPVVLDVQPGKARRPPRGPLRARRRLPVRTRLRPRVHRLAMGRRRRPWPCAAGSARGWRSGHGRRDLSRAAGLEPPVRLVRPARRCGLFAGELLWRGEAPRAPPR